MSACYVPPLCGCGGLISAEIGTAIGICLSCKDEYELVKRVKNE